MAQHPPKYALQLEGINKAFGGVKALQNVSLECREGEVHALLGENGAGKSTLMKILGGAYQADAGSVTLFGERQRFRHPKEAQRRGVSVVYQEFNLLPERSVAQNIFLGREPGRFGFINHRALNAQVDSLLDELGVSTLLSARDRVGDLSVAQQQLVEIVKALSFSSRILVMDEPTASLSPTEVDTLFDIIRSLKARGMTVIYISHRLEEIFEISDRVTVLKDGEKVCTVYTNEVDASALITMMVGRELKDYYPPRAALEDVKEVVLEVKNAGNDKLHDINLTLRAGEIVGVAGLQGSGRTELARALFGADPFTHGSVTVGGEPVELSSPIDAVKLKIGLISEDRKGEGLVLGQPISDNIMLPLRSLRPLGSRLGLVRERASAAELAQGVDVRAAGLDQEVGLLSGGNQQKVVLAKWLATAGAVLIFDEPTRGIDVNGKASIHLLIRQAARAGLAVLMISSELLEVIGMSDRILVMRGGTIAGELQAGSSEEDIMTLAAFAAGSSSQGYSDPEGEKV